MKTGKVLGRTRARHRAVEFRKFLDLIDARVPADLDVHLILDNDGTHKTALIRHWFAKRPRYHLHFTPTYGWWLNTVERWFAGLTTKQLRRGVHRTIAALERAIREYIEAHHVDCQPFVWTKNADDILASIARFADPTRNMMGNGTMQGTLTGRKPTFHMAVPNRGFAASMSACSMSMDGDGDMSDDGMTLTGTYRGQVSGMMSGMMSQMQICGGALNNGHFTTKRQ